MKKNLILVLVILFSISNYAQKKKHSTSKEKIVKEGPALAKADNLAVEIKNNNFQITVNGSGKSTDAIIIKNVDSKFAPFETKLKSITANGAKLYLISWTEKVLTKTENKTENTVTVYSQIFDIPTKTQVFTNTQLTSNITEKVFLDRLKNASETQEKVHREGYELTVNPDGTLVQKSKTQEIKWSYDSKTLKYVDSKKKK